MPRPKRDWRDPEKNQGLVWFCARRYIRRIKHTAITLEDLVQEGNIGMMRAMETFDESQGYRFSTYATHWICHHMRRAIMNLGRTVRIPVWAQDQRRAKPQPHDALTKQIPLTMPRGGWNNAHASEEVYVPDLERDSTLGDEAPEEMVSRDQRDLGMRRLVLSRLNDRERMIIRMRFWEGKTLKEIGDVFGLSRERARQIEAIALAKLRKEAREFR